MSQLRRKHGLKDRYTRLREAGLLTAEELADQLGIRVQTVWRWYRQGEVQGRRYNDRGSCLFLPPDASTPKKGAWRRSAHKVGIHQRD